MSYIKDEELRKKMLNILEFRSRNAVVKSIQETGAKFHQYHIDRFLAGDNVSLNTLKKLNEYVNKQK